MLGSQAWHHLTPPERCVYIAVAQLYNGSNNGSIAIGVRRAGTLAGVHKDTAAKSMRRLQDLGFIEQTQAGHFDYKLSHAATWRLTDFRCDQTGALPSKAFMKWRPDGAECGPIKSDRPCDLVGHTGPETIKTVRSGRTVRAA
jgi:hypothetical protein